MDVSVVFELLNAACFSTSPSEQETAMRSLQELEDTSSSQSSSNSGSQYALINALASIILASNDASVREEIRLLAAICLKNTVQKSWGKMDEACRSALWQLVHKALEVTEKSSKISAQMAVLTAKMCRREWPSDLVSKQLFPYLFSLLSDRSNWRRQAQTVKAINEILTEISSMKLPNSRAAFASLASEAFPSVLVIWSELSTQLREGLSSMSGLAVESPQKSSWAALVDHLCSLMVLMRQLLLVGYESLSLNNDMNAFFGSFVGNLNAYIAFCSAVYCRAPPGNPLDNEEEDGEDFMPADAYEDTEVYSMTNLSIALAVRALVAEMSSLMPLILQEYPLLMVPLLLPLLGFAFDQLMSCTTFVFSSPLMLSSITILSNVLSSGSYTEEDLSSKPRSIARRLNANSRTTVEEDALASKNGLAARIAFFDEARIQSLVHLLLHSILYPSKRELRVWEEDAEEYYVAQAGMTSSEVVRIAGEGLFLALLDYDPDRVTAHLVSFMRDTDRQLKLCHSQQRQGQMAEMKLWSNCYLCCGLGVYKLGNMIDATEWFSRVIGPLISSLVNAGSSEGVESQVLLLRLVWLCSCWAHTIDTGLMPPLLDLFIAILVNTSRSDAAVRLTTIDTLLTMLHNDSLSSSLLLDRFIQLIEVLCPLASTFQESESMSKVVELVAALIASAGPRLRPLLSALAMHLQSLWLSSDPSSPLKLALIQALTNLVKVAREDSIELHSLLVPVLGFATSGSDHSSFLTEEGLNLWLAVVRNAGSYSANLDELFRINVPALITAELIALHDHDKARTFMLIVESYAILGGLNFLSSNANALKLIIDSSLCRVLPRVVAVVIRPLETMLLVCPTEAAVFLLQCGALSVMLRPCAAAVPVFAEAFAEFAEVDVALLSYLSVVARLLVAAPQVLQQAASSLVEDGRVLLHGLLRLLVDKFDAVGYSSSVLWRRKLWCIAMLVMFNYGQNVDLKLLDWLPEILVLCDDVVAEQRAESEHHPPNALSSTSTDEEGSEAQPDPLALSFNRIIAADYVTTVSLRYLVSEQLEGLRRNIASGVFDQIMRAVEPAAVERLMKRSNPNSPAVKLRRQVGII